MFQGMAEACYCLHYQSGISPYFNDDEKKALAEKISGLTLRAPIWMDRGTNHIGEFPELKPYVNAKLTGLYLCAILSAIVDEFKRNNGRDQIR